MHLLKQGAKPSKPRKERKTFAAATFIPPQEYEEEKKEEEEEKKEEEGEASDKEMAESSFADVTHTLRHSKRNRGQAPPK